MPQIPKHQDADSAKHAATAPKKIVKRKVDPSEFIVKHSNVKGGRVTRAMAYED